MASGDDQPLAGLSGPSPTMPLPQSYDFCLRAMRQNRNRAGGSPGEMSLEWRIPIDGERHDVDFVYRDDNETATFEQNTKPTKPSNGTKARFCEL